MQLSNSRSKGVGSHNAAMNTCYIVDTHIVWSCSFTEKRSHLLHYGMRLDEQSPIQTQVPPEYLAS